MVWLRANITRGYVAKTGKRPRAREAAKNQKPSLTLPPPYCLMPNHWHFVVWPERDGDLPAFMQQVNNTHVKRWKEHRHEIGYGHLYQGRYKCFPVETEDYFYQVVRYVERNALRANLVERAESWRWSSLRRVEREDPAFPILSRWPLPRPTDWLQIVNQPQTEAEVAALRCCVNRGRPFGDPNWVTDTTERLGLEWTIRPRGRPKKQSQGLPQLPRFGGCHLSDHRRIP